MMSLIISRTILEQVFSLDWVRHSSTRLPLMGDAWVNHLEDNERATRQHNHNTLTTMIYIVMNKDIAPAYARIDDAPEPYFPEPMGSEGDDWVELNIEGDESSDVDYITSTYDININHIIAIGVCDDEGEREVTYRLVNG